MIKCDLHTHSTASDGNYSPQEVVNIALKNNVKYLALTDHDSINGIEEAKKASENTNLTLIPGIELSTVHNEESIHVIGLFKGNDYLNPELINFLNEMREKRKNRALIIIEKLKEHFDIIINPETLLCRGDEIIARPHIAQAIVDAGYPYSFDYIFNNIIGNDCPAYVPSTKISTEDGIKIIKNFNGIAILAHPKLIKKTPINEFIIMGIDGLEVFYYLNTPNETEYFKSLAKEHNLLMSVGSDCHGIKSDGRHGDIGEVNFDKDEILKLLSCLNLK